MYDARSPPTDGGEIDGEGGAGAGGSDGRSGVGGGSAGRLGVGGAVATTGGDEGAAGDGAFGARGFGGGGEVAPAGAAGVPCAGGGGEEGVDCGCTRGMSRTANRSSAIEGSSFASPWSSGSFGSTSQSAARWISSDRTSVSHRIGMVTTSPRRGGALCQYRIKSGSVLSCISKPVARSRSDVVR